MPTIIPPYHFVPVPQKDDGTVNCITDTPIFHDGSQIKAQELLSGEIRCTMTALTPLLVGNDRYEISTAKGAQEVQDMQGFVYAPEDWNINNENGERLPIKENKSVLEPMRLPDGRVIIGGDSIKGMLRQSIGALLGSPMERVAERSYGYKPNIQVLSKSDAKKYPCPAVIMELSPLKILLISNASDIEFLSDEKFNKIKSCLGKEIVQGDFINNDDIYCRYVGGIDGTGQIAEIHNALHPEAQGVAYKHAIIKSWAAKKENGKLLTVSDSVLNHYERTIDHLRNRETGHLSGTHPLNDKSKPDIFINIANSIRENSTLSVYQLVYVELKDVKKGNDAKKSNQVVTSIGHHFHYQWRYVDTVRTRWNKNTSSWETRSILSPAPCEKPREGEEKPEKLSGARLFFGYTVDKTSKNQEIALGVGKGDFEKLAGRISCNIAVEDTTNPQDRTRFINHEQHCVVPLKPLGMPRPSAVEYYLEQNLIGTRTNDGGILITYGDLLNDDPTGELNGRKFYLHQPNAADENNYSRTFITDNNEFIATNQASFARFVLKSNAKFKFTLRFKDLRPWELGILLTVLEMRQDILKTMFPEMEKRILQEQTDSEIPCYAHKLGYGRPLGLGSITIKADTLMIFQGEPFENSLLEDKDSFFREISLEDAKNKLEKIEAISKNNVLQWLKVHQYKGRTKSAYPMFEKEIFKYHSNIRLAHAKSRRSAYIGTKKIYSDALKSLPN